MDIRLSRRRHHAPLDIRDAALRVKDHDVHTARRTKGLDRSATGITGGRPDNRRALIALRQHVVHQPRQKLHGDVLERERRSVKEFQHEAVGCDLHQWRHRRMPERRVCLLRHARQILARYEPACERGNDPRCDLVEWKACQRRNLVRIQCGPGLGQVETAVARKAGEQHIFEVEARRGATC